MLFRPVNLNLNQPYPRQAQQLGNMLDFIRLLVVDGLDTHIDQHLEAMNTGTCRNVYIRILDRDPMLGSLRNGIDFSMDGIDAILLNRPIGQASDPIHRLTT